MDRYIRFCDVPIVARPHIAVGYIHACLGNGVLIEHHKPLGQNYEIAFEGIFEQAQLEGRSIMAFEMNPYDVAAFRMAIEDAARC